MTHLVDMGAQVVARARAYFDALGFETVDRPGGFGWRVLTLEQTVWSSPVGGSDGATAARVNIATPLVSDVQDRAVAIDLLATYMAANTLVAAPTLDDGGAIVVSSTIRVDREDPAWGAALVSHVARMQIASAETMVDPIVEATGGTLAGLVATAGMAASFTPERRDDSRALRSLPVGLGPRWELDMLDEAARLWNEAVGGTIAFVEGEALTTGVPWRPAPDAPGVAMIQARLDVAHDEAGRGLLMLLDLDEELPNLDIVTLNRREMEADIDADLIGSWCRSPVTGHVAFVAFLPEDLASVRTIFTMMASYAKRAEWVRALLFTD